jgi:hypothetical protein
VVTLTIKERILEQLERMSEAELIALERELNRSRRNVSRDEQLRVLRALRSEPWDEQDILALEKATTRRSVFGGRTLDLEPDDLQG